MDKEYQPGEPNPPVTDHVCDGRCDGDPVPEGQNPDAERACCPVIKKQIEMYKEAVREEKQQGNVVDGGFVVLRPRKKPKPTIVQRVKAAWAAFWK